MKKLFILVVLVISLGFIIENPIDNFHSVVANKFYRSAQLDSTNLGHYITKNNIATVVNLRGANPTNEWYIQEKQATAQLKTNHVDLKLTALGQPKINRVKALVDIIQTQAKPILFHCKRGADRSGLASAVALLLEDQNNIVDIEHQVSWRYQAVEANSTGKLFVGQYLTWLDANKATHTPKVFLNWLDNEYIDDHGNMLFTFEQVNDIVVAGMDDTEIPIINIDREKYQQLSISGWTIDYVGKTIPKKVSVLLDQRPMKNMLIQQYRPDVAKVFGNPEFTQAGWGATELMTNLANNCYQVQLQFTSTNNKVWTSKVKAKVCIKS